MVASRSSRTGCKRRTERRETLTAAVERGLGLAICQEGALNGKRLHRGDCTAVDENNGCLDRRRAFGADDVVTISEGLPQIP